VASLKAENSRLSNDLYALRAAKVFAETGEPSASMSYGWVEVRIS